MPSSPEIEKPESQKPEEAVKEIPTSHDVQMEKIEKGVKVRQDDFTAQVKDPKTGQPLTQSPSTQTVTITLPATQSKIRDWSEGDVDDALTWFGKFWLRMIKKAAELGWKVIGKGGE